MRDLVQLMKKYFLLTGYTMLLVKFTVAQNIFIRSFTTTDSVLLRWAPANVETWKEGIKNGYVIERFTADEFLDLNGKDLRGKGKQISNGTILPLAKPDSAWKTLVNANDANSVLFSSLYETHFTGNTAEQRSAEQITYGLALKACDLSSRGAKAYGLFFTDNSVHKGESYVYSIYIPGTNKSALLQVTGKPSQLNAPKNIRGDFRNRKAAISFSVTGTREDAAGYIIERSEDSIHFARVNSTLLVFAQSQYEQNKTELVYQDSLPQNHKTFWYRVKVYSYFGMKGPPSEAVKGTGHEEWILFPEADTVFSRDNKTVNIEWHAPDLPVKADLTKFIVMRSSSSEGKYELIFSGNKSSATCIDKNPFASDYYKIGAVNYFGDTAFSYSYFFGLIDSVPPAVPANVSGIIDTNGIVRLSWDKNTEADLKGYRVFRANTLKEEFVEVSDSIIRENNFTDTIVIQTLTRNVYYEVRSIDTRYNNSRDSKPCLLKRPDKIPPVGPVLKAIYQTDSTICFSWINSSSDDVLCKELLEIFPENKAAGSWNGADTVSSFIFHNPEPGAEYHFVLSITDSSGNKSTLEIPAIKFQSRILPPVKNLSAVSDPEKRMITLSWSAPKQEVDRYIVYKAKKGEPLRSWKTIDGKTSTLTDKELYPGNIYIYKIKAVMKNGAETIPVGVEVIY